MRNNRKSVWAPALAALVALSGSVYGQKLSGKEIADKAYNREDGKDSHFKLEMVLVDKQGGERKRTVELISKDNGDLVNTFVEFTSPADINGTRFLTLENKGEDDTQHLYLPALGRSRRIVGGQKKQSFVNTDFTYEDMERRHPDRDKHTLLKEEKIGEWDCYVVESAPVNPESSQYSKWVAWVEKQSFVVVKVDLYDKKGENTKHLTVKKLEKKSDIWTAMDMVMENIKGQTKTIMKVQDVKYNQGVDDKIFTVRHLEEK